MVSNGTHTSLAAHSLFTTGSTSKIRIQQRAMQESTLISYPHWPEEFQHFRLASFGVSSLKITERIIPRRTYKESHNENLGLRGSEIYRPGYSPAVALHILKYS